MKSFFAFFLTLLLLLPQSFLSAESVKPYDFLIKNAVIFDGRQTKSVRADVAVKKNKIEKMGTIEGSLAREVIDGKGLVLTPGFIDAHTHSDFNPLVYAKLPNKVMQGVTTEIIGNCGMSAAPVLGTHGKRLRSIWLREGVQIPEKVAWRTYGEYRHAIDQAGSYTNLSGLVGHGNLRSAIMGFSPRPAGRGEIEDMKKLLREAMEQGASGISYGLVYLPGMFAEEEELVELCREAARNLGVCAFHIRNEGSRLLEAITEALRIGEKAQAPVQISHLKAAGRNNWPKIDEALKLIAAARQKGQEVYADVYPYTASYAELGVILPDEIYAREDRAELFQNALKRAELIAQLEKHYEQRKMRWDSVMIASVASEKWQRFEGETIKDIARETNKSPEQFLVEILAANRFEVSAFSFSQSEKVIRKAIEASYVSVGSDSIADGSRRPHPRAYGTFPLALKKFVREKKDVPLGEMIRRMTSQVADHFKIKERGEIKEGYYADLVLFDAGEIEDKADYDDPSELSRGVKWVFVNGVPAVKNGKPTAQLAGKAL